MPWYEAIIKSGFQEPSNLFINVWTEATYTSWLVVLYPAAIIPCLIFFRFKLNPKSVFLAISGRINSFSETFSDGFSDFLGAATRAVYSPVFVCSTLWLTSIIGEFYKSFNFLSIALIVASLILLAFKGLNYGVDFKGGTLIELRTDLNSANIKKIRDSFNQLNLGDVSVKNFGNDTDFIIKFEKQNSNDPKFIDNIKTKLSGSIGTVDFRRVENVGPKVSAELLQSCLLYTSDAADE